MSEEVMIKVDKVSKSFKLPHQKHNSIKSLFINVFRLSRKSFEKQEVLKDVSFEVKKGDFFAIVGRNGSGKSTLLKLLAGIYSPNKGSIYVGGKLIPFIELGVGFNPELTGRENVFLNGALLGFSQKEMEAMYDSIVEFAELERFMDQKLKNYSSGMQVRLAFSVAIRARGDILLLDEVLAVGDAAFQQKCFDYFEELKEQKQTVVFVTHDMSAVRRFCTKAIYVKEGKLLRTGSPGEIADIYIEDNIQDSPKQTSSDASLSRIHKLSAKVLERNPQYLKIRFNYGSKDTDKMYVGLSIQRAGVSIAEITTLGQLELTGNGYINYSIELDKLNAGSYQVGAGLFKEAERKLVAVTDEKCSFVIKGEDFSRGAALKLEHNWER